MASVIWPPLRSLVRRLFHNSIAHPTVLKSHTSSLPLPRRRGVYRALTTNSAAKDLLDGRDERFASTSIALLESESMTSNTIAAIVTSIGGPPGAVAIVVAVPMLAPRSYTREDVVELQCHGSDICMQRVLRACIHAGAKLAQCEFTLRAFLNGRLDLCLAENVKQLVSAKCEAAADAALAGIQIAMVGQPNVGKSSLLNAWRKSYRAIVTEIAGTTGDVVEASISVHGISVTLLDTTGIRETDNTVEKIGVERTEAVAKVADVVIMAVNAGDGWTAEVADLLCRIGNKSLVKLSTPVILVVNKIDCAPSVCQNWLDQDNYDFTKRICTSAVTGQGIQELESAIIEIMDLNRTGPD